MARNSLWTYVFLNLIITQEVIRAFTCKNLLAFFMRQHCLSLSQIVSRPLLMLFAHLCQVGFNGKIATLAGLIFCLIVVLAYRRKAVA